MRSELHGLYAVTPDTSDTARLLAMADAALQGGCRWMQYRDKISSPAERQGRAATLATLCRRHGAQLIINDDIGLAIKVDAAGVHLGRDDGDIASARRRLGPGKIIGASCYGDFASAIDAAAAGADYAAFGAVFPSPTKPEATNVPLALFTRAQAELPIPTCAIGGITLGNAADVIRAGAALTAVITDLFDAADIAARATAYRHLFEELAP